MGDKLYSFSFKDGFKQARKNNGYTQKTFSEKFNISIETVKNWEQGRNIPEIETLEKLCNFFHCDIDYLFGNIKCETHDKQFICDYTGLSEEAVEKLKHWNDLAATPGRGCTWARNAIRAVNDLFHCDIYFSHDVLNQIADYCYYRNVYENPNTNSKERTTALQRFQLALFNATNGLSDCIKDIFKEQKAPDTN